MYFLKEQYDKTMTEVVNTKNSDGLSGLDKMEMNLSKIDEGIVAMAELNIEMTIADIIADTGITISDEEIQYYRDNLYPSDVQIELVYAYYAKYFNSYRDLNLMNRRQYIILVLILKKRLLLEAGYDLDNNQFTEAVLPYILTGNLQEKVNNRLIRNNKFMLKVEDNYMYETLNNRKYKHVQELKHDYIHQKISTFINTKFTYVVYEAPELLGKEIEYNEDKITDEILFFLNNI